MAEVDGESEKELHGSDLRTAQFAWPRYTGMRPTELGVKNSRLRITLT